MIVIPWLKGLKLSSVTYDVDVLLPYFISGLFFIEVVFDG